MHTGIHTVLKHLYPELNEVVFVAYTPDNSKLLRTAFDKVNQMKLFGEKLSSGERGLYLFVQNTESGPYFNVFQSSVARMDSKQSKEMPVLLMPKETFEDLRKKFSPGVFGNDFSAPFDIKEKNTDWLNFQFAKSHDYVYVWKLPPELHTLSGFDCRFLN